MEIPKFESTEMIPRVKRVAKPEQAKNERKPSSSADFAEVLEDEKNKLDPDQAETKS